MPDETWRRPTRCDSASCAEVAIGQMTVVIRNSQRPDDRVIFDHDEWSAFLADAKAGRHDLPATFGDGIIRYIIWSNQHQMWWGPNGVGYTPWLEEAARYTMDGARAIVDRATLKGQLAVNRPSRLSTTAHTVVMTVDEHLMLAPESLAELLATRQADHG